MKRRVTLADVRDYCAVVVAISAVVGVFAVLPVVLKVLWIAALIAFVVLMMKRGGFFSRGKMDSHRRDDRSGSDQSAGFRGGSQRGSNIDHSTLV